ncbi:hypothetical protein PRIPAC_78814 [Pristionchus pacificus]|uniref:Uncharacterized protein n=1 Tax=Pristionchus pacificus TaxID=54126 RepID=A0A2A6C2J4_PRIPA|nr:hypothetical protein PRIPAC_78814 [Pristionchus pacificus]|eukprot:PDM72251.1 hypothetical protein PRIPAC_38685 [Pristionchus pacificus]
MMVPPSLPSFSTLPFTSSPILHTTHQPIRGHFSFLSREEEICRLGWLLLFLWLAMVIYMTKEIWCGRSMSSSESSDSTKNLVEEIKNEERKALQIV